MDQNIKIIENEKEAEVFIDGEFLGSVPFWNSLEETQKISAINDLKDQSSNND